MSNEKKTPNLNQSDKFFEQIKQIEEQYKSTFKLFESNSAFKNLENVEKSISEFSSIVKNINEPLKELKDFPLSLSSYSRQMDTLTAISQPIKAYQENIAKSVSPILSSFGEEAFKPFKKLIENINPLSLVSSELQESIKKIARPLVDPDFCESLKKHMDIEDQKSIANHKYLKKYSCFLSPFVASNLYTEQLEELEEQGKNPWDYLENFFSSRDTCEDLIKYWSSKPTYQKRIHFFKRAIEAHIAKDYVVSIPLLLIQFDGLIIDLFPSLKKMCDRTKTITRLAPEQKDGILGVYQEMMGETIIAGIISDVILETWFPGDEIKRGEYPNRHQILHGGDLNYHDQEKYSLKCIMIIDSLDLIREFANPSN